MNLLEEYVINHVVINNQSSTSISNNEEGFTEVYEMTTPTIPTFVKAMEHYGVPAICVLGILGDVTSILVFICTSFRYQPCSQYLASLAIVDTLFLVSKLLITSMAELPFLSDISAFCSIIVYTSYVCSFLSAWFVVLMMTERYIVVNYPFRASSLCNKKKSIIVISMTTLFSLFLYSHSFFTTVNVYKGCSVRDIYYQFVGYFTYVDSFLVFVVPFFSVVILNLKIILTVRKFRKHQGQFNLGIRRLRRFNSTEGTLNQAQVRSTKMLVWVSSVFILLYMPSYAVRLLGVMLQKVYGEHYTNSTDSHFYVTQSVCQFLYYLKFCIDFIVYVMTSQNFRRNFTKCLVTGTVVDSRCGCRYRG